MHPVADTDTGAVVLLFVLLFGSITAGILFVSPLGRRDRQEPAQRSATPEPSSRQAPFSAVSGALKRRWASFHPMLVGSSPADAPAPAETPAAADGALVADTATQAEPAAADAASAAADPGPSRRPVPSPRTWSTGRALPDERYRSR